MQAPVNSSGADTVSLSPAALRTWEAGLTFEEYVLRLLEAGLVHDAVFVAAAPLSARELVWWSALCLWAVNGPGLSAVEDEAIRAAVHWVRDPLEPRHAHAAQLLHRCPPENAAYGMTAAIVSFGFAAAPDRPLLAPASSMGRRAALASIFASIAQAPPAELKRYLGFFGLSLSKSANHWNP